MKNLKELFKKTASRIIFYFIKDDINKIIDDTFTKRILTTPLIFGDPQNLSISETAVVNNALFNLVSGKISVGAYSFFGHDASILTGTHDITKTMLERQTTVPDGGRDIIIEEGVWIASRAIVIGPCRIGKNSVIDPCVIVTGNIPDNTKVTLNKEIYKIQAINNLQ